MEERIIAYCGITCSSCDAYLATQTGDPLALERVAAAWRVKFDPSMTAACLVCDGCLADSPVAGFCNVCPIRVCARERSVASCAYCDDYGCDKLAPHFEGNPKMREVLDAMRRTFLGKA